MSLQFLTASLKGYMISPQEWHVKNSWWWLEATSLNQLKTNFFQISNNTRNSRNFWTWSLTTAQVILLWSSFMLPSKSLKNIFLVKKRIMSMLSPQFYWILHPVQQRNFMELICLAWPISLFPRKKGVKSPRSLRVSWRSSVLLLPWWSADSSRIHSLEMMAAMVLKDHWVLFPLMMKILLLVKLPARSENTHFDYSLMQVFIYYHSLLSIFSYHQIVNWPIIRGKYRIIDLAILYYLAIKWII